MRRRHYGLLLSLLICVVVPATGVAAYLWTRAADQYASTVGFSIRQEEIGSPADLLGGLKAFSGSSSNDADILYEFIRSQKLVGEIDALLDLRSIWARRQGDVVFGIGPGGTIEDLLKHWRLMVRVSHDTGTGLMEVRVLAFSPEEARALTEAIFDRSAEMINALSAIAREDAIGYARADLDVARERLRDARVSVTEFRNRTQIVDPTADMLRQGGVLGTLESQLAEAMIEKDILDRTAGVNDPRRPQLELRIEVIEDRIIEERRKIGIGEGQAGVTAFADTVGEFERLAVEREFAEQSYVAALAAYDLSLAEARRKSRYLAAHVEPTMAQKAEYPRRWTLLGLTAGFLFLIWSVLALVFYSLRDRR